MPDQNPNQLALVLPKSGEEFTFFFGSEEVRGENGGWRGTYDNRCHRRRLALVPLGLHESSFPKKGFSSPRSGEAKPFPLCLLETAYRTSDRREEGDDFPPEDNILHLRGRCVLRCPETLCHP